jgi:hypothetical protein
MMVEFFFHQCSNFFNYSHMVLSLYVVDALNMSLVPFTRPLGVA